MIKLLPGAALALILAATPLSADAVTPTPGVAPMAGFTDTQAIDCIFRLIRLSNLANTASKDEQATPEKRKGSAVLEDQTARGVSFYMAVLYTLPWVADRKNQSRDIFIAHSKESTDVSSQRTSVCLTTAMDAQSNIFAAVLGK